MSGAAVVAQGRPRLERAVGEPVEAAVRTDTYFDLMTKATRPTKTVKRKVERRLDARAAPAQPARRAPTCSAMREQLSRMERRINQLSERRRRAGRHAAAPPRPDRVTSCRRPSTQSTSSPASTATSSGRCCAPATASATCAARTRRSSARRRRTSSGSATRPSCGATATARSEYGPPVLIVHSLVSRSYILDLRPGNSLVEYLTGGGPRRLHARLGRARRARRRQRPRALRRLVPAARGRRRPARDAAATR